MTVGDFTAVLDLENIGSEAYGDTIIAITNTVYLVAWTKAGNGTIQTYSISALGVIAPIDTYQFSATCSAGVAYLLHISGTIYAIIFSDAAAAKKVLTIDVADDGTITGAPIATFTFYTGGTLRTPLLHVSGTTYAICLQSATGMMINTMSISNDGTTISNIDTDDDAMGGNINGDFKQVSTETYVACRNDIAHNTIIRTYNISDSGIITLLDSEDLDGVGGGYLIRAVKVGIFTDYTIFAFSYDITTGGIRRERTIQLNNDGTIGAVIDTDDTIWAGLYTPDCIIRLFSDIYLCAYANAVGAGLVRTIHISSDGTIGTIEDTLSLNVGPATSLNIIRCNDEVYGCFLSGNGATSGTIYTYGLTESVPDITTLPATLIKVKTAQANGTLNDDGGQITTYGFDYGLDTTYGTTVTIGSGNTNYVPIDFDMAFSVLRRATWYHYRAFGTNNKGTTYGADEVFRTLFGYQGSILIDELIYNKI